ncbi:hypothetical protein M569_04767, partial [Genlisea aurea]
NSVESFLIKMGLFKKYTHVDMSKVKYLAIAVDSEEALVHTQKLLDLMRWLQVLGVKNLCLYDVEGVLKRRKDVLLLFLKNKFSECGIGNDTLLKKKIHLEMLSSSDSKTAVAKAANSLFATHYLNSNAAEKKQKLTEADMISALKEIGYKEPDPDLMFVYGPARCHLGFPPWRIRYTEIVHMGSLNSMNLGSLLKAIHRFSAVHQNYGK